MELTNLTFLNKEYFFLLVIIPIYLFFVYKSQKKSINFSFLTDIKKIYKTNNKKYYIKIILTTLILINFILIIANPNLYNSKTQNTKNGIDIVLALDVSLSMEAKDLLPNRIESAKNVITNFISNLKTDRLGLVIFAGKPFSSIPLTFDYKILQENIKKITTNSINQQKDGLNGTAIGDAILMSKTLFKKPKNQTDEEYKKREKVIILLTDGEANVGVEPNLASLSAKKDNIKIYTIGIGSDKGGIINYNIGGFTQTQQIPPLNDKDLKQIAQNTGGKYFKADSNDTFTQIFDELSKLDKNDIKIEQIKQYTPLYKPFTLSLCVLLGLLSFLVFYKIER